MNTSTELDFIINPGEILQFKLERDPASVFTTSGELHGILEWNDFSNVTFTPERDYRGYIKFNINYTYKGVSENRWIYIELANTFKPRARIIKIIGQELISNDVIALVELIKNSYDADATEIEIHLNDIFSKNGEILIRDSGTGMTYEKVVNVWLEPATPDKKSKGEQTFSACFKRRFLGEKGIGRFAVHRLGDKIELITRAKINCDQLLDYETKITIDWSDFTDDKYLSEIPVKVSKIDVPQTFVNNSGTLIRVTGIHPWKTIKNIKDAALKIRSLESPVSPRQVQLHESAIPKQDPGITINLDSNNDQISRELKETKSLKDLLTSAFYKLNGIIDDKGTLVYDYEFNRPDLSDLKRSTKLLEEYLPATNPDWFEEHPLSNLNSPGQFEVNFYAWDLDTATLRNAGLADYYRNIIKPNAGVRIYRDNFRVWPYGEPDDDWLGLDLKRLNTPKERPVSRNQVFGIIHTSSIENPQLKDQSNREGLIINDQYEQFYQLVSCALSVFAKERKADKVKIDKVKQTSSINDIVTDSISGLRKKMEKRDHLVFYNDHLNQLEIAYKEKINDVLERYMMAAAIGISYSIPIHEMKLRLTSIRHLIDDLNENPKLQDKYLRQLSNYVEETEDIVKAVSSMMSRQKRQKVNLLKVGQNMKILKASDLKKYGIELKISGDEDIEVDAVPGLLNTAVLNLVDNAIYWTRSKKINMQAERKSYQAKVEIEVFRNSEGDSVLTVQDNGDGLKDPHELLIEPYYSRKSDGLGLGLFLVNEIMIRSGGRLSSHNNNGAMFKLTFKK